MTKKKGCGCPEETFPGVADDDRFRTMIKSSLIEAMTPVTFTFNIKIRASASLEAVGELLEEFTLLKNIPDTDDDVKAIANALDEMTDIMVNLKDDIIEDIRLNQWSPCAEAATNSGIALDIDIDVYNQ